MKLQCREPTIQSCSPRTYNSTSLSIFGPQLGIAFWFSTNVSIVSLQSSPTWSTAPWRVKPWCFMRITIIYHAHQLQVRQHEQAFDLTLCVSPIACSLLYEKMSYRAWIPEAQDRMHTEPTLLHVTKSLDPWFRALITGCSITKSGKSISIAYSMRSNTGLHPLVSLRTWETIKIIKLVHNEPWKCTYVDITLEIRNDPSISVTSLLVNRFEE